MESTKIHICFAITSKLYQKSPPYTTEAPAYVFVYRIVFNELTLCPNIYSTRASH